MGKYAVETWADGYGLWHARVRDRTFDYSSERLTDADVARIRAAGKRAILREIKARQDMPVGTIGTRINWNDCRQHGARAYVGSPDTLHIIEKA